MRGLSGKAAVVTGGATLIGNAVVRGLCERGAGVAVADIDAEAGERLAGELGERVLFVMTDIRDDAAIERFVAAAVERFGGIDFLVNLALHLCRRRLRVDPRGLARVARTSTSPSAVMMAKAVHPHMRRARRRRDRELHLHLGQGRPDRALAVSGGKAALVQLTRNMAMDLAADGIRVNSVSPGWTWSRVMVELTGGDRAKTDASRRRSICSAAWATPRRSRTSSPSSAATTRRS